MARKAFSIHSDFYEVLNDLTPDERGNVVSALISWATDGDTEFPALSSCAAILFRLIRNQNEREEKRIKKRDTEDYIK